MIAQFLGKIFGTKNTREIKRLKKIVDRISALENDLEGISDQDVKCKREEFKSRYEAGESLDASARGICCCS